MTNSGRVINYSVRPAKNIERKMMRDAFLRLFPFSSLMEYQYIGFGSKYFVDFMLFHKTLHISKMISIESDSTNQSRYIFNKPFGCVEIKFGKSCDVLPRLRIHNRAIIWLDYDERFTKFMLDDVAILVEKIESGSVVSISYNSETYKTSDLEGENKYRRKFEEIVGEENIPIDFDERGWTSHRKFSVFLKKSIAATIHRKIEERNHALAVGSKMDFKQVMYFDYADGQHMSTVCFLFFSAADANLAQQCKFEELYFCRANDDSYEIRTPNLTLKEIRTLMEKMPNTVIDYDANIFTKKDVEAFAENYKYFPSFNEVEVS